MKKPYPFSAQSASLLPMFRELVDKNRNATFAEVARTLSEKTLLEACDDWLMSDDGFRSLFQKRAAPKFPPLADLLRLPSDSFGATYARFMHHYALEPNFFPVRIPLSSSMAPSVYAAWRLNATHDFWHIIGGYETTDSDEARIQSFIFAQLPIPLSFFFRTAFSHESIANDDYKHLRDIQHFSLSPPDIARGENAAPLGFALFEEWIDTPLETLRASLRIAPRDRSPAERGTNTCGGANATPFFA